MRFATLADLPPATILCMRTAWINRHPDDPWFLPCEAIAAGERLAGVYPDYVHVCLVVGADGEQLATIEEEGNGMQLDRRPLDARFDAYAFDGFRDPSHPGELIARQRAMIGTKYNYPGILTIGAVRVLGLPPGVPALERQQVCSTSYAEDMWGLGYTDIFPVPPQYVMPADFPGKGMRLIARGDDETDRLVMVEAGS